MLIQILIFVFSSAPLSFGLEIRDQHRMCKSDGECAIVLLQCACSFCSHRPDDLTTGRSDAVNRDFLKEFADRSACSDQEIAACATAGACPSRGENIPKCRSGKCTLEFRPNSSLSSPSPESKKK